MRSVRIEDVLLARVNNLAKAIDAALDALNLEAVRRTTGPAASGDVDVSEKDKALTRQAIGDTRQNLLNALAETGVHTP